VEITELIRLQLTPFRHIFQDELGVENILGHTSTNGDINIRNVWIGYGVTKISGLKIGDGAVLSAKADVFKDTISYCWLQSCSKNKATI
jgi:acetyltransferase-like isoleucine patch superfamily enzyme